MLRWGWKTYLLDGALMWLLAGTSIPYCVDLSIGCLRVLMAWQQASPRMNAPNERAKETSIKPQGLL